MSKSKQKISLKERFYQVGLPMIVALGLVIIIKAKILTPLEISNSFMEPSFKKGDTAYINRLAKNKNPLVGDIVLARSPLNSDVFILARILGKPGDEISISAREAFRNGIMVSSDLFPQNKLQKFPILPIGKTDSDHKTKITVPERTFYLLCDNREVGIDSRELGFIAESLIVGKVW